MKQDKHMEFRRPPVDAVFKYSPLSSSQKNFSQKPIAMKEIVSVTSSYPTMFSLF